MAKHYTDEFKARAMLRAEELSNVRAAARELKVSESTLRRWITEKPEEAAQIGAQVKRGMLERLEDGAMKFYAAILKDLEDGKHSPGQRLTGFGIVFDKYVRLKEMATDEGDDGQLTEFVEAMKGAYERDRSAE